jgi:hypothetical protein
MSIVTRTINSAKNPRWANFQRTSIDLDVDFDELDEEFVSFNAHPDDIVSWGPELYNRAITGEFGLIADWPIPEDIVGDEAMSRLRKIRDNFLVSVVDPIVSNPLRWASFSAEKQQEWTDYRQALLDLPQNSEGVYLTFDVNTDRYTMINASIPTQPE